MIETKDVNVVVETEEIVIPVEAIGTKGEKGDKGDTYQLTEEDLQTITNQITNDIPKVFINGNIPTDKTNVKAELTYVSKTDKFHSYINIKCQGTSSMSYPKKNFTIKMFEDEDRTNALNKNFKEWGAQNKFCLKANYIDHTHARNIIGARLWSQFVESREDYDSLPNNLKTSTNNCAIDGFPIKVYTNGEYQGLYTWNIPKDAWMFKMDEDTSTNIVLCGEDTDNCNKFNALWGGVDGTSWSVEVGNNSAELKTSLNNLITAVINATDENFESTVGQYLDINSAILYYIFLYVICGHDNHSKNMLLYTYDGTKYYCGAYDLDSIFGLMWDGQSFVDYNLDTPVNSNSNLWTKLRSACWNNIKETYASLRNNILTYSNLYSLFEYFCDSIGNKLYEEDIEIYPNIPSPTTNNIKQIRSFIKKRLDWVDIQLGLKEEPTTDNNLIDLSNYTYPSTLNGITLNYDSSDKSITLNGTSESDFGIYIPMEVVLDGTYILSYIEKLSDKGIYISLEDSNGTIGTAVNGWGANNKTIEASTTTTKLTLWFDANQTFTDTKLYLSLVKDEQ